MHTKRQSLHDQAALMRFKTLSAAAPKTFSIYDFLTLVVVAESPAVRCWLIEQIQGRFPDEQYVPEAVEILAPIILQAKDERAITTARAWIATAIERAPSFRDVYKICALFAKRKNVPRYIIAAACRYWEIRAGARPELTDFFILIKSGRKLRPSYLVARHKCQPGYRGDSETAIWQKLFLARAKKGDADYTITKTYLETREI